jgi:CRISPR/Cas system-associated exonuclease Cas4 (RecB family)
LISDVKSRDAEWWMAVLVERCLYPVCVSYRAETGDDDIFAGLCRLLEAWRTYTDAVDRLGGRPAVRAFLRSSEFFEKNSAAPRTDSGSVGFYSCREAKGLFFPVVFLVGCSELLFPSAGRRESVVPSASLQEALDEALPDRPVEVYAARSQTSQLKEEYHLLYLGLTRATEVLHITAPERFGGQDHPAPASILRTSIPETFRRPTPRQTAVPPQVRFANAWVTGTVSGKHIERRLAALSPAGALWRNDVPKAAPVAIAPFPLSKSTIETFLTCPRRFFYRKILRIPEEAGAPAKVGLLLHAVMAVLGERFRTKRELRTKATTDVVRDVIDTVIGEDETIGRLSFYERALRYHLGGMVDKILRLDAEEPDGYTITAVEKNLPFSHGGWGFSGRIDRVEKVTTGAQVIVDFKSGKFDKTGKTLRRKTLAALDAPEKANWQVPLYVWGFKDVERTVPRAFKHVVTSPGEEPFAITLFVCPDDKNIPPEAESSKRCSYITEIELEEIMSRAVSTAAAIFEPRARFEKAETNKPCRTCQWRRLCEREQE